MLYETAARASEILALNVEDLLPRLPRLPDGTSRTSGPLFLANRRSAPRDICPHTGRHASVMAGHGSCRETGRAPVRMRCGADVPLT
jgi:integrase